MQLSGRWVYLDNHKIENVNKMYAWSQDLELIGIECGNLENLKNTVEEYMHTTMESYIKNTHENGSSFCHFGIYRNDTNELVGYIDFQDIEENLESAELSLSIPDKYNRNRIFGIDAFLTSLNYAFSVRKIRNIIIRTSLKNEAVLNMGKKLGLKFKVETIIQNKMEIGLAVCVINNELYKEIRKII